MKRFDCIQGSSEWAMLRAGLPTASQFHRIITPSGGPSKSAEMYLFELLAERVTGEPTVGFTSHWMDRGSELEAEAVAFYHFMRDCETEKVGFILNDTETIGASPDRLVGNKGLLEIKVCKPATHVGYLLQSGSAYKEHRIQAQAQLWIAEREWNDLLAYNPLLPPALYRVERDESFIETIAAEVNAFSQRLEALHQFMIDQGWTTSRKKPEPRLQDVMADVLRDFAKK